MHINKVRGRIEEVRDNLHDRAFVHDMSKLHPPEKEGYDQLTPRLAGLAYGSEEYRASLRELKPVIDHHYAHNSHHPEHYSNGIAGMSLLDLIEMFCDWKAASERHNDGNFATSLTHNAKRFEMTDQLASIFENTAKELGW
jgi:hypothetical protein